MQGESVNSAPAAPRSSVVSAGPSEVQKVISVTRGQKRTLSFSSLFSILRDHGSTGASQLLSKGTTQAAAYMFITQQTEVAPQCGFPPPP